MPSGLIPPELKVCALGVGVAVAVAVGWGDGLLLSPPHPAIVRSITAEAIPAAPIRISFRSLVSPKAIEHGRLFFCSICSF